MVEDPSAMRVAADLADSQFLAGVDGRRWRLLKSVFPNVDIAISATEPDGGASEYAFRFELSNYPAQAPLVRIWDPEQDTPLPHARRPKGGQKVTLTFQHWSDDTVYRPWERRTGPHNSNAANLIHLAWRSDRTITFILEDLHGILNLNARSHRHRPAA